MRMMREVLGVNYDLEEVGAGGTPPDECDLLIIDGVKLERWRPWIEARRVAERPLLLPVLLVTTRPQVGLAWASLWRTVDELIISPVEKVELQARVEVLLHARALSKRAHAESQTLAKVNRELESTLSSRDKIVSEIGHELRSPLNSVIGFSGVLLQGLAGELNDEQHRQIEMISHSGQQMLGSVNGILDYARLASRVGEINTTVVDIADLAAQVLDEVRPLASEKGLDLRLEVGSAPKALMADEPKLRQVLVNLVSNAVKYTAGGHVVLRVTEVDGRLVLEVEDTGLGMSPEDAACVFDEFFRAPSAAASSVVGTGLGLSIARKIVTVLDGTIGVHSELGVGSVFTVDLPTGLGRDGSGE
jgi:signal transduction histidine kinase